MKYPHDPDMLAHIQWLWSELQQVTHQLAWVKSHQDENRRFEELPRNARLNILADELATMYLQEATASAQRPKSNPHFFPTSRVCLIVKGQRVTTWIAGNYLFSQQRPQSSKTLATTTPQLDQLHLVFHRYGGNWNGVCLIKSTREEESQQNGPQVVEHRSPEEEN